MRAGISRRLAHVCGLIGLALSVCVPARAQTTPPTWLDPALLDEARKEGSVTVYSTTNEEEGLQIGRAHV